MALTRKMLKAMGIEDDKIDQIIDAHTETVDSLKEQRDQYKADAEKLTTVQAELDSLKGGEDWKAKYESEHQNFESYKTQIATEKETEQKKTLYKQLLSDSKVDKKRIDAILKVTDLTSLKIKDGKLENVEDLKKSITDEWSGFIVKDKVEGAGVDNPPEGGKSAGKRTPSRAAELANRYHNNLYGETKKEN